MNKLSQLIVLLFVFSITAKAQKEKMVDQILAVVGDKILLESELEGQVVSLKTQGVVATPEIKCNLFETLLFQKLLLNQADLDSVVVSDDQVEGEMNRRLAYFVTQIGSEKKLEQYYKKSMIEIKEEFRVLVRNQLVTQTMQSKITADVKITPNEVKEYFNNLPEDSIPLINSEIELAQILIQANESPAEKEATRAKIKVIRERVLKGEELSTLAILYSDDEGSAQKGGELGFMGRAELVPEFSAIAFKLKNNTVSEIVETEYGFHILQLIERRGQKVNVRHLLITTKVGAAQVQKAKNLMDSVANLITIDSLTFAQAAEGYSDDETSSKSNGLIVNPQTGTSIFEVDQLDPQLFYIVDKMKAGETSKPVPAQMPGGRKGYRIVQLISKTEPHKASLSTDYAKLQNAALMAKQNIATAKWVQGKMSNTYIHIEEAYQKCDYQNNWIK